MNASPSLMIFAAGFGTRMGSLTDSLPKPMLPIAGRPMIDLSLRIARDAGIQTIVANTHYLHEKIEPHLKATGVTVVREEPAILETGGGLKNARKHLTSPTFTLNPDCIFLGPNPLTVLLDAWTENMQALLLIVEPKRAKGRLGGGDFSVSGGKLSRGGDHIYVGAQLIRTEALSLFSETAFSLNLYWDHISQLGGLNGVVYDGTWCDIGTLDGLHTAEQMMAEGDV